MLVPYFVWGSFYSLVNIIRSLADGESIVWKEVLLSLIFGKAATPLYYIVVLIQLTLLTPLIIKIIERRGILWRLLWVLTPLWRLIVFLLFPLRTGEFPEGAKALFPMWFFFYYLGLHIQFEKEFFYSLAAKLGKGCYVIGAVCIWIVDSHLQMWSGISDSAAISQLHLSSFLYSIMVILWLLNCHRKGGFFNRILYKIGNDSYAIYYVHILVQLCVVKACIIAGLDRIWLINVIICFLVMLVGSLGIIKIVRKLAYKLHCERYLKIIGF